MRSTKWAAFAAAGVLALGASACGEEEKSGGGGGGGEGGQNLSGTVKIDGSSTVQPFAEAAAELFNEENPDVRITVGGAGTGDGFEKFCQGEIDISDASREIEKEEEEACSKEQINPTEVQVANDGVAVVTNKQAKVDCLTTKELKSAWEKGSNVETFADIKSGLPETKVSFFSPGTESGTFEFFTEEVNEAEEEQREGAQTSADDNQLVTGVSGDEGGFGYFGYSFFEQNQDKLNAIGIDAGDGCVKPSLETIQNGEYKPLSRPLFMYPSDKALARREVKAFIDFTVKNQQRIAEAAKIVPMTQKQASKSQQALQQ